MTEGNVKMTGHILIIQGLFKMTLLITEVLVEMTQGHVKMEEGYVEILTIMKEIRDCFVE